MSERSTTEWTETPEEVFGAYGAKGTLGENFLADVFDSWGWEHSSHPGSKVEQCAGVDVTFRKPSWASFYTADVKNNLNEYGAFYVEVADRGWLFHPNKNSDRIWHVNPNTMWMAWYDRDKMKSFIRAEVTEADVDSNGLFKVTLANCPDFVTRRKATL